MADKVDSGTVGETPDAAAARVPTPAATVGQTLVRARTALGLSLEQCATELRIEQPQLAALENDQFERIGVPVFVKGYLRQYGQRLGLDVRELLATYYRQGNLQEIEIKPSRTIKLRDDRQLAGWAVAILVIAALAVFLAVWWFGDFQISAFIAPPVVAPAPAQPRAELPQTPAPAAAPVETAPVAEPVAVPVVEPQEAPPSLAPAAPQPAAAAPPVARAAEVPTRGTVVALAAAALPDAVTTPRAPPDAPPAAREPANDAAPAERPPVLDSYATDVELAFDQESWAEVVDARGERLFSGNGARGRRVVLHGEPPFSVVLGNADGVRVQFDGGPYPVPTEGRDGKRARFSLDISED